MLTPIAYIIFNRPRLTGQSFAVIRAQQPSKLFIIADGPRQGYPKDAELCAAVRDIVEHIDWDCDVRRNYADSNLGCKLRPSSGLDWVFSQVDRAIVLEDDCLPHPDFFSFCEWALESYQNDKRIWHINGNNFDARPNLYGNQSIAFVGLAQVWGWATWSDRWIKYQSNPFYLAESVALNHKSWIISETACKTKIRHLELLKRGLDAWDYQWQMTILNNRGLAVCAKSNLVTNIGGAEDATHTFNDERTNLPVHDFDVPIDISDIHFNDALNAWYESRMHLVNDKKSRWHSLKREVKNLTYSAELLVTKYVFNNIPKIVIASTGRAGSTLLTEAIADAFIIKRYSWLPNGLKRWLRKQSLVYVDRLSHIDSHTAPVIKTHDLPLERCGHNIKYIFVYGNPLDSALSVEAQMRVHGRIWGEEHIYHLRGSGEPEYLLEADVLNYEKQMESWCSSEDVYIVHYDDLWDAVPSMSDFTNLPIDLPQRKQRKKTDNPAHFNRGLFDRLFLIEKFYCNRGYGVVQGPPAILGGPSRYE